ncbi:ThiF family adenylyltransferase [Agrobacterium vitis]|uniref:ThiF family adenylyltransferase n=1 Tax=Agrobacterium vitis TaxID=373 RepID=A0ABD6GDZ1_AGRVI|nr:ThiF family adenylyltransferase [Agrobacterium vitis]MCF1501265.1 ThiF family adenylyltransferase [Allorhizobium sp. Av2]MCF1479717.1 ThiF family adenylyltransferase [Agrobacterium vitis]MCM2443024.1 ThiF family adenylyltransferase [Agrobacterium vitis]MUO96546.1 ThiF family adenylyltransferase [Agrobacterium vitis]MUP07662.1 ThiF family adenylyltransferase [Agrobacterium vitis]
MYQKLASHNDDIRRLVEKGYAVGFDSNYLIIRDIPYVDSQRGLQTGAFVAKLVFTDQVHVKQDDHQVFFAGSAPHNVDGSPITNMNDRATGLALGPGASDIVVQRQLSNKPNTNGVLTGFANFFDKIDSYAGIISGPATELHGATPYTFRVVSDEGEGSVFKFNDTLTSRAEITELSSKFSDEVVAIIGLGGTGAYVLDFLVKTPVREILGFDVDAYHVHNAYRSPGKLDEHDFQRSKAEVYQERYENFRHGLKLQAKFVDVESRDDLRGVTFAFVCVDKGSSRSGIFSVLMSLGIPFIDVGMGLNRKTGLLNGMLRATLYDAEHASEVLKLGLSELSDPPENLYRTNVQIGELNALNAALAVIKYKQLKGFYHEEAPTFHTLFEIGDLKTVSEIYGDETE